MADGNADWVTEVTFPSFQGLKSMYLNGEADIGFQYKLNKAFSLSFEPSVRFALSSINKNISVKTNLNSIGLSTGLVFKL